MMCCRQLFVFVALLTLSYASYAVALHSPHPQRPHLNPSPYSSGGLLIKSPPRDPDRYCYVAPSEVEGADDADQILQAFRRCNNGGTVVMDKHYTLGSPLDLTFLKHIDIAITGELYINPDIDYWAKYSFKYPSFQNQTVFWRFGGEDINIFGDLSNRKSVIDGRGFDYWKALEVDRAVIRPTVLAFDGANGATMSNLRMRNPPSWFNIIANSTGILFSDMILEAQTDNFGTHVANSDGWNTYRSDHVVIQNSFVNNTDDCVAFKPNSTNVVVQNLRCIGSHGISVGSLGQYEGITDIVENLYVYNISMTNASDGARIKVWPGADISDKPGWVGGGGLGYVRNVTYDHYYNQNNDNAIQIMQCYGQDNRTLCLEYPSKMTIQDVTLKNFWGYTSQKYDPQAGMIVCSGPELCSDIRIINNTVKVPSRQTPVYECENVDTALLDITCVTPSG